MIHSVCVDVTVRGTRGPFYYLCPIGEVSLLSSREDCVTHSDISEAVFIVRTLIEHTTIVALISYPIRCSSACATNKLRRIQFFFIYFNFIIIIIIGQEARGKRAWQWQSLTMPVMGNITAPLCNFSSTLVFTFQCPNK